MSLGQYIIENITDGVIIRGVCAHDEKHGVVLVFSANAAEQIEAIVGKGIAEMSPIQRVADWVATLPKGKPTTKCDGALDCKEPAVVNIKTFNFCAKHREVPDTSIIPEQTAEIERMKERLASAEWSLTQWDEWCASISDDESDEAPWNIAAAEFAKLQSQLADSERSLGHWEDSHRAIEEYHRAQAQSAPTADEKDAEMAWLRSDLAEALKNQPINTSLRLFDLVRYQRSELHEAELITDEEYMQLCAGPMAMSDKGGSPSRQRLEDYDEIRAELTASRARVAVLEGALDRLEAHLRDQAKNPLWTQEGRDICDLAADRVNKERTAALAHAAEVKP